MCGRYELVDGQRIFMRFHVTNLAPTVLDNRDVRPTQQVPVVLPDRILTLMPWGITPSWSSSKPLINAHAEGIETKPSFRRLLPHQRCLIPASAYFEWQAPSAASSELGGRGPKKTKYRIGRRDGVLFAFAGLYSIRQTPAGDAVRECTIMTTTPSSSLAHIHNRMPVILLPDDEVDWLDPDLIEPEQVLRFLAPYPDDLLEALPA